MTDIAALRRDIGAIPAIDDPTQVALKSRDFYWYSPVLKRELDKMRAELIVAPRNEAEIVAVLRACHARGIAVTPRGAGTGNYGQAMPLRGGIVLDLSALTGIVTQAPGRMRARAGTKLIDIDRSCQAESQQEMRMHPSTLRTATIGGFVCGGSGGVGSITWGGLRDRGNVTGLRLITMEAEPRTLELRGDDVQKAIHAYGTTGIVTEVEMPLAPACDWVDAIVGFSDFAAAAAFGYVLGCQDAVLKKLVTAIAAPIPELYFRQLRPIVPAGRHVVLTAIAPIAWEAFAALVAERGGEILYRSDRTGAAHLPPIYEFTWNHTTLQALKVDRRITYHQILYPPPDSVRRAEACYRRLGDDVLHHLEFVRFDGQVACFGLPLVRYTTDDRLFEIAEAFEAEGCPSFSPHHVTLEEGGMKRIDPVQLAFKREADPQGLLNPGKMIAWDNPDYDATATGRHLFPAAAR